MKFPSFDPSATVPATGGGIAPSSSSRAMPISGGA